MPPARALSCHSFLILLYLISPQSALTSNSFHDEPSHYKQNRPFGTKLSSFDSDSPENGNPVNQNADKWVKNYFVPIIGGFNPQIFAFNDNADIKQVETFSSSAIDSISLGLDQMPMESQGPNPQKQPNQLKVPNANNVQNVAPKKKSTYEDEVVTHNVDSKHYPHQYAIQIRWGRPGQASQHARPPLKFRTANDETSRYRQFAHQEEEHWHDKKWINLGSPAPPIGTRNGGEGEGEYVVSDTKFNTLPVYVRPIKNGANMRHIQNHFRTPNHSFPVNKRFAQWANAPVNMRHNNNKGRQNLAHSMPQRNFFGPRRRSFWTPMHRPRMRPPPFRRFY